MKPLYPGAPYALPPDEYPSRVRYYYEKGARLHYVIRENLVTGEKEHIDEAEGVLGARRSAPYRGIGR